MPSFPPPPPWVDEILTVGVTGTNGKSSTVRWIAAALGRIDPSVVTITTLGHQIGAEPYDAPPTYAGFLAAMELGRQRGARHGAIELTSALKRNLGTGEDLHTVATTLLALEVRELKDALVNRMIGVENRLDHIEEINQTLRVMLFLNSVPRSHPQNH